MKFEDMENNSNKQYKAGVQIYKKRDGLLWNICTNEWSMLLSKTIVETHFELMPWKPKQGDKYWFIDKIIKRGYYFGTYNQNSIVSQRRVSRGVVYETKQEVIDEVRKLGWKSE